MRLSFKLIILMAGLGMLCNCKSSDDVEPDSDINEFVWDAMSIYYYWVDEVADLSVEKYSTRNELYDFLDQYPTPEQLFNDLLAPSDINKSTGRPFSWIVDDYEALEASFQGVSKSFGYEFTLYQEEGSSNIYGLVKYVAPNGPAANGGLMRGDIFVKVDDTFMREDNLNSLLGQDTYTLTLGEVVDDSVAETDQTVTLTAVELNENPIFLSKIFGLDDGKMVGYLVYNQFVNNASAHNELNNVFGDFQNAGVSDLVLDMRYNPGGSVSTAQILGSMIYGAGGTSTVFTRFDYNEILETAFQDQNSDLNIYFTNNIPNTSTTLNRLSINRVFILVSGGTASASELIIAGLSPYIDVTLIGTRTVGKNLGSVTLYDSPNYDKTPANSAENHTNPDHRYAIQPIISRFTNINNIDYGSGFEPDVEVNELNFRNDLKPLGDEEEALLLEALNIISGNARRVRDASPVPSQSIMHSEDLQPKNTLLIHDVPLGILDRSIQ